MTPTLQILLLVVWANAAPVLTRLLLGHRLDCPLDGGRILADGRPLLGTSKTWRGLAAAILTTPLFSVILGLSWIIGLVVAVGAMLGDVIASFIKRRMGRRPSEPVFLLDQIPEALIPVLALQGVLGLSLVQGAIVVIAFTLVHIALTPVARRLRSVARRIPSRSRRKPGKGG
jgi:CDP-2,3-bis-(O-geranylgeranyl)-sn-glycerol synthase